MPTLSSFLAQMNDKQLMNNFCLFNNSTKEVSINELKNMDFFVLLSKLKKMDNTEQRFQLFMLYFLLNDKPIIYKEYNYERFIRKFIRSLSKFNHNQIFLVVKNKGNIRKLIPLFTYSDNFDLYNPKDVFKLILKNINDLDNYSIIIKSRYIANSNTSGYLLYYPLYLSLDRYNKEFGLNMENLIIVNNTSYKSIKI